MPRSFALVTLWAVVFGCSGGGAPSSNVGDSGVGGGTGGFGAIGGQPLGTGGAGMLLDAANSSGGYAGVIDAPIAPSPDAPPVAVCGNSVLEDGETCDDGNLTPGDGCSGICRIEPNFVCPTVGVACLSTVVCGDSLVQGNEACDDGNAITGDGCSDACQVEPGFACGAPGSLCLPVITAKCGDGLVNNTETCDDGNKTSGDGCSADCQLESGFTCAIPGTLCVRNEYCGDGKLNGTEQCDDGNLAAGDGCSGLCKLEPFFTCHVPGQPCQTTIVCGDGNVIGDEACDDGNTIGGDGCAADCKRVEAGYTCPTAGGVGGACTLVPVDRCGDGRLSYGEYCDDGNTNSNDGCSATCTVETGYTCSAPGMACKLVGWCGDGRLTVAEGEQCDDGNAQSGDGCSALCVVETNFVCLVPGQACVSTVRCGDGKVSGAETCDDSNTSAGDGCSSTCQIETGWTCPSGIACRPTRCGDGIKVGTEQCDDGNVVAGDGCSPTCVLETAPSNDPTGNGWNCPTPGAPCLRTTCGNGIVEGSEACDDGNNDTGDGCSPFCRSEPLCPSGGGACSTACGDGLLLASDIAAGQECDDGNTVSGDGCSSLCKIEQGYGCTSVMVAQSALKLPIVYRDFKAYGEVNGHPDFERYIGAESGVVMDALGAAGKPVHVAANKQSTTNNDPGVTFDYFGVWYKDDPTYNKTIRDFLPMTQLASGTFQYVSTSFFPLDNKGWGNYANSGHNFHFTSEVRYWFEYKGNEKLDFTGDDDVWVFINRKLAVDLGGTHQALSGSVTLHASNGTGQICDELSPCPATRIVDLGLQLGSVYEIVVFQAERHTTESNYTLTLAGFGGTKSVCSTLCGDGIRAGQEACDLGSAANTGIYGTCNPDCTLSPRCGDGLVSNGELCDDGVNLSTYGGTGLVCAPGCMWAPYCGDGKIDGANGEVCDQGANNGKGYGYCTATCQPGPRCGDGVVTNAEECDDGIGNGTSASTCTASCMLKCGNGIMDAREQCDDGKANNIGGYGKCNPDCTLGPRCGDGIRNGTEICDDGSNDGSYGGCAPGCVLAPRCGDGVVQSAAGELCDAGTMNQTTATAYGKDMCTTLCQPAPYCGDHQVDVANGEACDDGNNHGQPGSCTSDCSASVPLPSCGDGVVQAPEQCDLGSSNGALTSTCDARCQWRCGNGFRDPGEECDDGHNDGSYGTCNPDCTLAGYCGDGVQNGPEACDLGMTNEANPYGAGKCTKFCAKAPYCGDGRIQTGFGEVCDSSGACGPDCKLKIIL